MRTSTRITANNITLAPWQVSQDDLATANRAPSGSAVGGLALPSALGMAIAAQPFLMTGTVGSSL